jgi:hypothetical protein
MLILKHLVQTEALCAAAFGLMCRASQVDKFAEAFLNKIDDFCRQISHRVSLGMPVNHSYSIALDE